MVLSKGKQSGTDSGSILYKKKFKLSSRCFVLICLGEKICVGILVIERYY